MKLREWRKQSGRSAAEAAREAGMPYSTWIAYENGSRRPRRDQLEQIIALSAGALSAEDLLGLNSGGRASDATAKEGLTTDRRTADPEQAVTHDKAIQVVVPDHLLKLASDHGLDVPALIAKGGLDAVAEAGRRAFHEANKAAIDAKRQHISAHGTFSERHGIVPTR